MADREKPHFKIDLWDYTDDTPPPFGHSMLQFFSFDPGYINLNHGAFGSLPTPVHRACTVMSDHIEANPDKFICLEYHPILLSVRKRLAKLIGAETEECVLVPNASSAAALILHGLGWKAGDVIVSATTTFANVANTVQYVHDLNPGVAVHPYKLSFPRTHAEILHDFREHIRSLPRPVSTQDNPNPKVVCVIDSLTSNPGLYMPWKEMVRLCRAEGILSIVDAAHSIGQEVNLDLSEAQPDFWFSNCHKWLFAKRACALLYVPRRNQHLVRTSIPTSHLYVSPGQTPPRDWMNTGEDTNEWATQFEWTGTRDLVPYLSINAALDFREWLGGEGKINEYCHDLALRGGKRLAEILDSSLMDQTEHGEETLNMVNVELPLQNVPDGKIAWVQDTLRNRLMMEFNTYAAHFPHNGKFWVRCSAQIWNELKDFDYIGNALKQVCGDITKQLAG